MHEPCRVSGVQSVLAFLSGAFICHHTVTWTKRSHEKAESFVPNTFICMLHTAGSQPTPAPSPGQDQSGFQFQPAKYFTLVFFGLSILVLLSLSVYVLFHYLRRRRRLRNRGRSGVALEVRFVTLGVEQGAGHVCKPV